MKAPIKIGARVRHPRFAGIVRVTKIFLNPAALSAKFRNGRVEREPRGNFKILDRNPEPDLDYVRDGDNEEFDDESSED